MTAFSKEAVKKIEDRQTLFEREDVALSTKEYFISVATK